MGQSFLPCLTTSCLSLFRRRFLFSQRRILQPGIHAFDGSRQAGKVYGATLAAVGSLLRSRSPLSSRNNTLSRLLELSVLPSYCFCIHFHGDVGDGLVRYRGCCCLFCRRLRFGLRNGDRTRSYRGCHNRSYGLCRSIFVITGVGHAGQVAVNATSRMGLGSCRCGYPRRSRFAHNGRTHLSQPTLHFGLLLFLFDGIRAHRISVVQRVSELRTVHRFGDSRILVLVGLLHGLAIPIRNIRVLFGFGLRNALGDSSGIGSPLVRGSFEGRT